MRRLRWVVPILCSVLIAGCGSGGLARVKGRVTLNGQPLEGAIVEFRPTAPGGTPASGLTDAQGRYELMYTFQTPGTPPGEYTVSISTAVSYFDANGNELQREECVPAKYNTQTQLRRTVQRGRNRIDFDL
ncbi:MAG: carboxypeptidase-like regulatory domain-containing protein [Thermoguttaceae bacterium]